MRRSFIVILAVCVAAVAAPAAGARVLLVGSYHGIRGQYRTVQAAVNAARAGDWILVGPGDYKTTRSHTPAGGPGRPSGVLITKRGLKLRGMNRNTVIIDGTRPGSSPCSRKAGAQSLGPAGPKGRLGLNGIMVWKANNVTIENLTVCNFLGGHGDTGNEIWWNGGDTSQKIGGWGYYGAYLTATSTFYRDELTAAKYGIFSSDWSGGTWTRDYASNFNDSGFYVGACQQVCDQKLNRVWSQYSSLGYSGSNSGGRMLIEYSEFDHNKDGFDTNSQNGDNPPPQDGACPDGGTSPITHTHSCWVFMHNYVHDNNNPNVPARGLSALGPVGTGMSVSGGRDDTIMDNTFSGNDAWGIIFVPFLDSGPPCRGGTVNALGSGSCLYDEWGDALVNNTFSHNGSYGHPTNGDFAWMNFQSGHPTSCWRANHEPGGHPVQPSSAQALQASHRTCDGTAAPSGSGDQRFLGELLCNSQVQLSPGTPASCPTGAYPKFTRAVMHPLPTKRLPSMPDPCAGVPANPWCPAKRA